MEIGGTGGVGGNLPNSRQTDFSKKVSEDESFEKKLQKAYDQKDEEQLKKTCREFESIFLNMMYKQMKATVNKSELIPQDSGREIFESMLDDKLMNGASEGKGMGLGDVLYKQLSRTMKNSYKLNEGGNGSEGVK